MHLLLWFDHNVFNTLLLFNSWLLSPKWISKMNLRANLNPIFTKKCRSFLMNFCPLQIYTPLEDLRLFANDRMFKHARYIFSFPDNGPKPVAHRATSTPRGCCCPSRRSAVASSSLTSSAWGSGCRSWTLWPPNGCVAGVRSRARV